MVLVDTSVWIDFLRQGDDGLSSLLQQNTVLMHPMILGELACGYLANRQQLLHHWQMLPFALEAKHAEVLAFIERFNLDGKGIGFIDLHLLVSCQLTQNARLWTRDKRLSKVANDFAISYIEC